MSDTADTKKHLPCNTNRRARGWILTLNNPRPEDTAIFKSPKDLGVDLFSAQLEIGEEGTPHIQAFLYYKNPRSFDCMKKKFPSAHLEVVKNKNKSYNYCKKEDTRIEGPWLWPEIKPKVINDGKPSWDKFHELFCGLELDFELDRWGF